MGQFFQGIRKYEYKNNFTLDFFCEYLYYKLEYSVLQYFVHHYLLKSLILSLMHCDNYYQCMDVEYMFIQKDMGLFT